MKHQPIITKRAAIILSQIALMVFFVFHNFFVIPAQADNLQQEITGTVVPSPTSTVAAGTDHTFNWLSIPPESKNLASDRSLVFLAGEMIFHGLVDASSCADNGLINATTASPCGEAVAHNAVILWQNQFDSEILDSSIRAGIPPFMFKNIITQESQFWPANFPTIYGYPEVGLGHVTEMGADTLLRWDDDFYAGFCTTVYSSDTCKKPYIYLPREQQTTLRGAIMQGLDADCGECLGGIDLRPAHDSIYLLAKVIYANYNYVEWMLGNITSRPVSKSFEHTDLWRFTLTSYNAGPGCLRSAIYRTQKSGGKLIWKDVSKNFDKGCEGAVDYVNAVTNIHLADPQALEVALSDNNKASQLVFASMGVAPPVLPTTISEQPLSSTPTPDLTPTSLTSTETIPVTLFPEETLLPVSDTPAVSVTPVPSVTPIIEATPTPESIQPTPASGEPENQNTNEIVVKFNDLIPSFIADAVMNATGGQVEGQVEALDLVVIEVAPERTSQVLEELQNNLLVEYAEPNYTLGVFYTPNDPGYVNQTYLADMQIPEAWDISTGQGVIVAVIDTGVDVAHPDLASNIWMNTGETGLDADGNDKRSNGIDDDNNGYTDDWQGWNFVQGSNNVIDANGHGTHGAGIIAAQMDNGTGIAGIAPSAQIMSLKALDDTGYGTYARVAEAIIYAVDNGAQVINLGFGGTANSEALLAAVDYAYTHNVLVVAAAGNTGTNVVFYPAAYDNVISVSALDNNQTAASFSTFNNFVDLAAPGVGIYSATIGSDYNAMSGTSMSSAQVSGVAALLTGQPQFDTTLKVRSALTGSADDLGASGWDIYYGNGLVRAFDALYYGSAGTPTAMYTPSTVNTNTPGPTPTGGVEAMATQQLWATAQTCSYTITNPGNSIDLAANGQSATCSGTFATTIGNNWTLTAIQNTTLSTIVSPVTLNIWFGATINNDTLSLEVFDGTTWTSVATFNTATTFGLRSYDVSAILNSVTKVNAAQVRIISTIRTGGADTITITLDEARIDVSDTVVNTPPTVNITSPANGSSFTQGTSVTFTGAANDAQDGNISTNLQWTSSINGAIGTGTSFNTSTLSVGTHTITAQVTDSGGMIGSASITVTITASGNTPPTVSIAAPTNGSSFSQGATVTFTGTANDSQDGNLSGSLQWLSNLDGAIGTGASFSKSNLSVGSHTITAQVTDSGGLTTSTAITITVTVVAYNPHGPYTVATEDCVRCHRSHTADINRLIEYSVSPLTSNAFCFSCHNSGAVTISTHSNADKTGAEGSFELLCIQCHDPHGSTNLSNVRPLVRVRQSPLTTTGPAVFTALTGANSYDEIDSALPETAANNADDICVTCHVNTNNPGFPMANHSGGGNHVGGADYRGQDCTTCHPHSTDSDPATRDGFMPNGCRGCHSTTQGARRVIAGGSGDFVRSSHHVTGSDTVTDNDCQICHDQSTHTAGTVRLKNADNASSYALDGLGDATDYENFCISCHDSNGANGDATPFSDNAAVIIINNSTWWTNASHNTGLGSFTGSCRDCHDNGHGSNKTKMLAPWNATNNGPADDPWRQEEQFCFICHGATGPSTKNMAAGFGTTILWTNSHQSGNLNLNDRHDVQLSAQTRSGAKIECVNCHDPHRDNNLARPMSLVRVDPDPSDGHVPGANWFATDPTNPSGLGTNAMSEWCLDCHDGSYPTGVLPHTATFVNILTGGPVGTSWGSSQHGAGSTTSAGLKTGYAPGSEWQMGDIIPCRACHEAHPNNTPQQVTATLFNNLFQLADSVYAKNGTTLVPKELAGKPTPSLQSYEVTLIGGNQNVNDYYWCNTCHTSSMGNTQDCTGCHRHGDGRY